MTGGPCAGSDGFMNATVGAGQSDPDPSALNRSHELSKPAGAERAARWGDGRALRAPPFALQGTRAEWSLGRTRVRRIAKRPG